MLLEVWLRLKKAFPAEDLLLNLLDLLHPIILLLQQIFSLFDRQYIVEYLLLAVLKRFVVVHFPFDSGRFVKVVASCVHEPHSDALLRRFDLFIDGG